VKSNKSSIEILQGFLSSILFCIMLENKKPVGLLFDIGGVCVRLPNNNHVFEDFTDEG
jgi:hypothetical protein